MSRKKNIHTVYNSDRKMWESKREGENKPIASSRTKAAAEEKSIAAAKRAKVEHVIHKKDGTISDSDSYGHDPHPPKDTKR